MANKVSYLVQLKDRFSAVGEKFSRQFKGIDRSVAGANTQLKRFNINREKMRAMSGSFARAGAVMSATMTVPAVMLGKSMIDAASDAQETANMFNDVFAGINKKANETAKTLAKNYGMADSTAKEMLATAGDLLMGEGFAKDAALDMAKAIVQQSADLTSLKNVKGGATRAANAYTKALLSEREMLKDAFKISLTEKDVQARAAIIKKTNIRLTEKQASAMASMELIAEKTKNAVGNLSKTWNDYANVTRRNQENLKRIREEMGELLLPTATALQIQFEGLINAFSGFSDGTKKTIILIGIIVAALGPLVLLLSGVALAMAVISVPVVAVTVGIIALIAAAVRLAVLWDDIKKAFADNSALQNTAMVLKAMTNPIGTLGKFLGFGGDGVTVDQSPSAPSTPVNKSGGTVDGQITVSAAPGSKVEKTEMKNSGGGLNLGMNMAGAY